MPTPVAQPAVPPLAGTPNPLPVPPLRAVLHDPVAMQARMDAITCTVERVPGSAPPEGLFAQRTSPDGVNTIWGDRPKSCGGDHNVFGEVDCIFDADVRKAAVTTADATYLMRSNSPLGLFVRHGNDGVVSCTAMRIRTDPSDVGPLRHHVWSAEDTAPAVPLADPMGPLVLNSALAGECLGFIDDAGERLVAVLPDALDDFEAYHSIAKSPSYVHGDTGRIVRMGAADRVWTVAPRVGVVGRIVSLPKPLDACDGISRAVLLRDMPEMTVHGLTYPHPPRAERRPQRR